MKTYISLLMAIFIAIFCCFNVYASDPNIDGGGGGTEGGTSENFWSVGNDGVRVTIVRESDRKPVSTPIDFSNVDMPDDIIYFGYNHKLKYSNGGSLKVEIGGKYVNLKPKSPIPPIVSASGGNNISAVKEYFGRSGTIQDIADQTGFEYSKLINGNYVIMLEPIVYITYNGLKFAMTATEAALQDFNEDGALKNKLGFITHQNLPLAMFLEKPDLGYPAWKGATSGIRANNDIVSQLGIGTVRFSDGACCNHHMDCPCIDKPNKPTDCECKDKHPGIPCEPTNPDCDCKPSEDTSGSVDYEYHTDTDVITSVYIYDKTGRKDGINPDVNATVRFTVGSNSYTKSYVIPPDESTLVWFKWRTPKTPQIVKINVSVTGGGTLEKSTINANVTELTENTPPDPRPTDKPPNNYKVPSVPKKADIGSLKWGIWKPWWFEYWVWEEDWQSVGGSCGSGCEADCSEDHSEWVDMGEWVDHGWWKYDYEEKNATASTKLTIKPSDEVPTAKNLSYDNWEMKSGYGISMSVKATVKTSGSSDDVSPLQNVVSTFPEFDYLSYNRILERESNTFNNTFRLKVNKYSFKGARSHYTPIWFPDNKKYEPQIMAFDAWCPAGQLVVYESGYVNIFGDVYDDWNISPDKE